MSKKLILFAHPCEAKDTLSRFNVSQIEEGIYEFEKGIIAVAGMGCFAIATPLFKFFHQINEIWNLGFAGALSDNLAIGTILPIGCVDKYLYHPALDAVSHQITFNNHPSIVINNKGYRLLTSDFPIHSKALKDQLKEKWDLVDMEGYAIAYPLFHLNKPCQLWKIISDFASEGGREYIHSQKEKLSSLLADHIENLIYN